MPYQTNDELPDSVKRAIPSDDGRSLFRGVFNGAQEDGLSEARSFAVAWGALQNAGYEQSEASDKWVKKAETYNAPKAARDNAAKVLRWRDEHGDEVKGMTRVGWTRANQLASNESLSLDTVKRMSQFARHRQNAEIADEYKGEPWKDAGYVAWLGWGGDEGINWAQRIVGSVEKRSLGDDQFSTPIEAAARAHALGLEGVHVHQDANGQAVYMPGRDHASYIANASNGASNYNDNQAYSEQGTDTRGESLLSEFVSRLREALFGKPADDEPAPTEQEFALEGNVIKRDDAERIVWGWATVVSKGGELVTDLQGDVILPSEMERFATEYMLESRVGKDMHNGDQTSITVHSFPMTKQLAEAFGIETDLEGWIVAQKIMDDSTWASVMKGERLAFSIGGIATTLEIEDEA